MSSNIRQKEVLFETEKYMKHHFDGEGSGHDWWHISRVRDLSLKISEQEGGNCFLIEIAALLHDLDDWKLIDHEHENKTEAWLTKLEISETEAHKIIEIIEQVSFKGAEVETKATSLEAQIVQDADRLDAIGAMGIARTFAYGGNKGRPIYDPKIKPQLHDNFEAYKKNTAPTINHFYEKLLLLKDLLNTKSAKKIAEGRHRFMENFLLQFFNEWDGKF